MKLTLRIIILSLLLNLQWTPAQSATYNVAPKFGQCFMHSLADVDASHPQKNPISCSKSHNAEIIKVSRWPSSIEPTLMEYEDAWNLANSICGFEGGAASRLKRSHFNYWAWYTPSSAAWANGERWLRCDGMFISNLSTAKTFENYKFRTWTGRRV